MESEIPQPEKLARQIFNINNEDAFRQIALEVFNYQYENNKVYTAWCQALGVAKRDVKSLENIPFLPIQFFKTHPVISGAFDPATRFKSSGTTGGYTSFHHVKDLDLYRESFTGAFRMMIGHEKTFCILALLPSYLQQGQSSLVYMADYLIKASGHPLSGFYLDDLQQLRSTLDLLEAAGQPTVLLGVSYALLQFAEMYARPLRHTIIIETGGMKGRRKELSKEELFQQLRAAFDLPKIHSEYGMTELLSQAYAVNGNYQTPPWMKLLLREATDPLSYSKQSGAINVIDLANIYSCSFIATDDSGKRNLDGSLQILGRLDNSDIRGCTQLVL